MFATSLDTGIAVVGLPYCTKSAAWVGEGASRFTENWGKSRRCRDCLGDGDGDGECSRGMELRARGCLQIGGTRGMSVDSSLSGDA